MKADDAGESRKKENGRERRRKSIGIGVDLPLLQFFSGVIGDLIAFVVIGLFIDPVVFAVVNGLVAAWVVEGEREPAPGSGDPSWENDENGESTALVPGETPGPSGRGTFWPFPQTHPLAFGHL